MVTSFLNRDISWLSFNGRVLQEAASDTVPLIERIRFLSIFSSNLDEFYRVRMPALLLLHQVKATKDEQQQALLHTANNLIQSQLETFGSILRQQLIPRLQQQQIELLYDQPIPAVLMPELTNHFNAEIRAFLQIRKLSQHKQSFFPKSNALYLAVFVTNGKGKTQVWMITIPSDKTARFVSIANDGKQYIVFLEDIIKAHLALLFPTLTIEGAWNVKITRDAELELADEYDGDLVAKIEKQLKKRDDGAATRFLHEPDMPDHQLDLLLRELGLSKASVVRGGRHHNLKDLGDIPVKAATLNYPPQPALQPAFAAATSIFDAMLEKDRIIHAPYQSYQSVLRFFNEAATDPATQSIFVTLYRVAGDSRIVNALITAAENGKQVVVFIELKARFDEENNLRWSKRMKEAGITIINSIPGLKVHAKVALVKKEEQGRQQYFGMVATGNLNERTARFYTDHILLTTHAGIVQELELLFLFLQQRRKPSSLHEIQFKHLLVAQFNLQEQFLELIDREMAHAQAGEPSGIIIKLNNLEEQVLIKKLYEASNAGVPVQLIVRSICCAEAGVPQMSDCIRITRIVDRYLEHGRIFIFHNKGDEQMWMGSSDWMNRNVYRRIEVCCPVYDPEIRTAIRNILQLQLNDTIKAVQVTGTLANEPVPANGPAIQSQPAIYEYLKTSSL